MLQAKSNPPPFKLRSLAICIGMVLGYGHATTSHAADAEEKNAETLAQHQANAKDEDITQATQNTDVKTLEEVVITGSHESRDERGRNEVFEKDVVNIYKSKEEIERYKGSSVGDLFQGMNGVYSGDSRNSGALDPNIRGIQGAGRIPVTIDGTEQATSVWMGAAGISNRNYIDPNMIGSVMAEKGPSMTPGVKSGIGGSVQVRTLDADDIVKPWETFGIEVKASTASNSVKPDDEHLSYFGRDYRDFHGAYPVYEGAVAFLPGTGIQIAPRKGSSGTDFDFDDNAFRLALATKQENFDLIGAYSHRKRGNYYSGKGGEKRYRVDGWYDEINQDNSWVSRQMPPGYISSLFLPGQEVANTSSDLESVLLKGTLRLPYEQTLKFGYMRMDHTYGESSGSETGMVMRDAYIENMGKVIYQAQNPYSNVKQDSFNLKYALKPEGNKWINLDAGIWMTDSDSIRYQNGEPQFSITRQWNDGANRDAAWDNYVKCHINKEIDYSYQCANVPDAPPEKKSNADGVFNIIPRALQLGNHKRVGFDFANRLDLHPKFSMNISGNFSREKLHQWDASEKEGVSEFSSGSNYLGPRSGRRNEYNVALGFDWAATSWLQISGGYRYSDFWAYDDQTARRRANRTEGWDHSYRNSGMDVTYQEIMSAEEAEALDNMRREEWESQTEFMRQEAPEFLDEWLAHFPTAEDYVVTGAAEQTIDGARYQSYDGYRRIEIPYDGGHRGFASSNPFLNGEIDPNEMVDTPNGPRRRYVFGRPITRLVPVEGDPWAPPKKSRDHAWVPQIAATIFLNDHSRIYARYSEHVRFPSLFDATQGYSGLGGASSRNASRPEHAHNWEIGYAHDFRHYFRGMEYADLKINYFNSTIKDYMDRDFWFNVVHFDRKKSSGIEIQGRMDSGRYFANLGATYRMRQDLCDKDYSSFLDPVYNRIPECVMAGFPMTFSRTALQPRYSINLDAGARLMGRKLELGGRMIYHSTSINNDERGFDILSVAYNRPYHWNAVWVFDAYASYAVNDNLNIDFGINNVTNRYYVDPMARIPQPAPGRTMKLGVTARF